MNIKSIKEELTDLEDKYAALGKHVECLRMAVEAEKVECWPVAYDNYWRIEADTSVKQSEYLDFNTICIADKETGNTFLTQEAAKHELAKRVVMVKLKRFTNGFVPNWCDIKKPNFRISYNHDTARLCIEVIYSHDGIDVTYFATEENARAAIDTMGDELKILFRGV